MEPICARFQQAVWRLGRQWHGVHRRSTPIKVCRLGVAAIPWHWHQQLAHTDVRSTHPFSDCRRRPIAARGGGARLPAPVGQWGGQRRGYRSNTYRGPLQAAGRGMEAHGASSVGARPGGSRSPGGGVLRGHIRVHNTTVALIPRPPRPWTPPTHPRGHAGRLSHRKCRLQRPSTPRSRIGRFSQKSHPGRERRTGRQGGGTLSRGSRPRTAMSCGGCRIARKPHWRGPPPPDAQRCVLGAVLLR